MTPLRRFLCIDPPGGDTSRLSWPARVALVLTAPWTLIPWAFASFLLVNWIDGRLCGTVLPPAEVTHRPESFLFLQGGCDWGGAIEFVLLAIFLVFFGLLAACHLSLRLRALREPLPFWPRLRLAFRILRPFFVLFLVVLLLFFTEHMPHILLVREGCAPVRVALFKFHGITELDVPVLLMTAVAVYLASFFFIAWMDGTRLPGWAKTLLAPLFLALWLALGSDGQTPRAGQMLQDWEAPFPATRGFRHGTMLAWRRLCLLPLGVRETRPDPEKASLWYWTTGFREFGDERETSRSARQLAFSEPLPWVKGTVFAVPIATDDALPCIFPYCFRPDFRLLCGYMLKVDGQWRPLHFGRMDVPEYGSRDIHLKEGQPYWTISLTREGATARLNRFTPVCWWHDPTTETDLGAPPNLTPQQEPVPTQLCFSEDVPYAVFTNWIVRLEDNGYRPLHIWQRQ